MESTGVTGSNGGGQHVIVPLRSGGGKKMRKRRDLDALLNSKRRPRERPLLVPSTDDQDDQDHHDVSGVKMRAKRKWYMCSGATCRLWSRVFKGLLGCACLVAACAALWLFADVRLQLASMRQQVELVSAGNKGVPEALQQCHETTRKLAANQSLLTGRADSLTEQLKNITTQLASMQSELEALRARLPPSTGEAVKEPQLSKNVAELGSQIKDLEVTVSSLKEQGGRLLTTTDALRNNITSVQTLMANQTAAAAASLQQLPETREDAAKREQLQRDIESIRGQLVTTNTTFTNQLQWVGEEQKSNKIKLDKLLEDNVKMDSQIATLQGSQSNSNKKLENLEYAVGNLTKELKETNDSTKRMATQAIQLQSQLNLLTNDSQRNESRKLQKNEDIPITNAQNTNHSPLSSTALAQSGIFGPDSGVSPSKDINGTTISSIAPAFLNGEQQGKPNVLSAQKE